MHSGMTFKTVIGNISYDKKGDITRLDYVVYSWVKMPDGKISYVEIPGSQTNCIQPRSSPSAGNVCSSQ